MHYNTAHTAYSQNAVGGIESPTKLIEMLYEGVLRFIFRARKAMQDNDVEKKVYFINRTNAIFVEVVSVTKQLLEAWKETTNAGQADVAG